MSTTEDLEWSKLIHSWDERFEQFLHFSSVSSVIISTHERSASFSIQSLIVKAGIRQADSPGQSAHVEHSNCLCITGAVDHV